MAEPLIIKKSATTSRGKAVEAMLQDIVTTIEDVYGDDQDEQKE